MRKIARKLAVIVGELQAALKTETTNIITIGALLIEARDQLEHGQWMPWLTKNFDQSVSTAENYMNAARVAAKFPTVGNLKLHPGALYLLGEKRHSEFFNSKVIKAILQEAETEWVSASRAWGIADSMQPKPEPPTKKEIAAREAEKSKAWREKIEAEEARDRAEQEEAERLLDGPPPELPPAPEASPTTGAIKAAADRAERPMRKLKEARDAYIDAIRAANLDGSGLNSEAEKILDALHMMAL